MSTLSRDYEYGRIVSVDVISLGDNLAADAAISATSITVEDAADFDEGGGSLLLNDVVYTYTACDDDTGIISGLSPALTAAAVEGDDVSVYNPLYLTVATDKVAQVAVIGDDGAVDMLECAVALHLVDKLDEGVRGNKGESVKVELDGGEWLVVDIGGLGDPDVTGGTLFKRDVLSVTATGDQTFNLTYDPIPDSLHLRWEPINLDDTEWTLSGHVVTIPDPNYFEVGDVITAKYSHRGGGPIRLAFTDDFSDGTVDTVLVSDGTTRDWETFNSTWTITAGVLYPATITGGAGATGVLAVDTGYSDGRLEALVVGSGGVAGRAVGFRINDALTSGFGVELSGRVAFDSNFSTNGSDTTLTTLPVTFATGDLIGVNMVGSLLTFYKNGAEVGSVTSSSNLSATKHGTLASDDSTTEGFNTFVFTAEGV